MSNELKTLPDAAEIQMAPGFNNSQSWDLAQRIGKAFAASSLVPEQYRGNLANCIVALEMANRMQASPLMVMQNLYIVHGNPGWSSKFLVACFNQSGRFSALRYEWDKDRTGCRAWAVEKATGERIDGPKVTIEMAKAEGWSTKNGSKWKTMPELMLMYRAAAFLIRTYAPEISMGLSSEEELRDVHEKAPPKPITLASLIPDTPPPSIDMDTGEVDAPAPAPAPAPAADGPTFAVLADRINKSPDGDTAEMVLSQSLHLNAEMQAELAALVTSRFPS